MNSSFFSRSWSRMANWAKPSTNSGIVRRGDLDNIHLKEQQNCGITCRGKPGWITWAENYSDWLHKWEGFISAVCLGVWHMSSMVLICILSIVGDHPQTCKHFALREFHNKCIIPILICDLTKYIKIQWCLVWYLLVLPSETHAVANMTSLRPTDGNTSYNSHESFSLPSDVVT